MRDNMRDNMRNNMRNNMQDIVLCAIKKIAVTYAIKKVVLFGSRARGDHTETSDYDVAIFGDDLTLVDQALIRGAMEDIPTLKKLDVVFVDEALKDQLVDNIESEGVVIYEQTGNEADELQKSTGSVEGSGG